MTLGQSITFVARDQNSAPLQVQWFTTNSAVASVTSAGVVTARRVGRAVISARWGNQARYSTSVGVEVRSGFVVGSVAVVTVVIALLTSLRRGLVGRRPRP